ncbi:hypothetical protein [Aporhodopirellula aestuarii]|uniref:Pilus assembly protein PilP n=1 Tax=Aporhodopirellula aestuarii TaxID=2950107 RepID=A0ABT0U472_9BACT|nr:hypothetical protein [Aporhodopirellula aestuarii]MCM2371722.1 hypothetical protein [Aporhodopirellula aestuarii]
MFHARPATCFVTGMIAMAVIGCGIEPETISRIEQMTRQQGGTFAGMDDSPDLNVTQTSNEGFSAPFPDRRDPFHTTDNSTPTQNKKITASNVSVMGFAKLDVQQAILRIDDQTRFVVAGDRIGEIEVVSITPPRVRLKNGNLVWDASMFQNH